MPPSFVLLHEACRPPSLSAIQSRRRPAGFQPGLAARPGQPIGAPGRTAVRRIGSAGGLRRSRCGPDSRAARPPQPRNRRLNHHRELRSIIMPCCPPAGRCPGLRTSPTTTRRAAFPVAKACCCRPEPRAADPGWLARNWGEAQAVRRSSNSFRCSAPGQSLRPKKIPPRQRGSVSKLKVRKRVVRLTEMPGFATGNPGSRGASQPGGEGRCTVQGPARRRDWRPATCWRAG